MSFIKHGDGKIMTVLEEEEELTEQQKKSINDLSKKLTKQSNDTDISTENKSGRQ